MKERSFLDTNILLYTDDSRSPEKQDKATQLLKQGWSSGNLVISTQVLQEYFVAATRKLNVPVATAQRTVELLRDLEIINTDHADIVRAIEIHRLYQYSFWDSLIICTAEKASCKILLTEDLQHGQKVSGVRIENPFA
jgi:predicted nucleic acid-binding protein